jgi:hypothetical protein
MAQHPRVCDYVSLKYALKDREFEVMTVEGYSNDSVKIEHTKEEIRIQSLNLFGKEIDSLNLIDYKNDTIYILYDEISFTYLKSSKGEYRLSVNDGTGGLLVEPTALKKKCSEEKKVDLSDTTPDIDQYIYDWNGMEVMFKDVAENPICVISLKRLIFKDYNLVHVDEWRFGDPVSSLKKEIALSKMNNRPVRLPSEFTLFHVYDTISKKNNDEYICLMFEDENRLPERIKKGSGGIYLDDNVYPYLEANNINYLYEEPNTRSRKIYNLENEVLIIYDIVGLWYYVKTTHPDKKECFGWIKLQKVPAYILNAEFYK